MEEMWQIVHIPDNPPIPPDQQPTVDAIASLIDPLFANTLVRRLNQIAPLENLRHVKRVHKKFVQGGKTQLSVILCLASQNGNQLDSIQNDVQELMNSYQLSPFITKVCKYAASSKEEWEEQCKLWPTSYHPPTYNIEGITGFSQEDSQSVFSFMKYAIQLAKSGDNLEVNAAVIVDPSVKQVIAKACDQTCSCYNPKNEITLETSCSEKLETSVCHGISGGALSCKEHSNGFPAKSEQLYTGVSCLCPWGWAEQESDMSLRYCHPLRHASIVAIESSAARDRLLFPSSGKTQDNKSFEMDHMQSCSAASPAKRQKTNSTNVNYGEDNLDLNGEGCSRSLSARPYLCTGFDMYLVWEPCIMCAMALVHQRIRRIFFAYPNPKAGALGSVHRLQGQRSLNHHYAVFRVLVGTDI
ncbi:tRNA-specific adenosine deaminase TAD3 isoform X2 [Malus sylvestris]|uniref:tRNA-specific adenosine deaminase TAD3 isoform X2 n=1 Tax=Malus sylvestris TaxID=3752 RepID=UPI0021ABEF6A|nr:tRNA-specific adenosine deaminase TAD3 isoform X2 [Malus sylvestris]